MGAHPNPGNQGQTPDPRTENLEDIQLVRTKDDFTGIQQGMGRSQWDWIRILSESWWRHLKGQLVCREAVRSAGPSRRPRNSHNSMPRLYFAPRRTLNNKPIIWHINCESYMNVVETLNKTRPRSCLIKYWCLPSLKRCPESRVGWCRSIWWQRPSPGTKEVWRCRNKGSL